jgi:hypothetical protein
VFFIQLHVLFDAARMTGVGSMIEDHRAWSFLVKSLKRLTKE